MFDYWVAGTDFNRNSQNMYYINLTIFLKAKKPWILNHILLQGHG